MKRLSQTGNSLDLENLPEEEQLLILAESVAAMTLPETMYVYGRLKEFMSARDFMIDNEIAKGFLSHKDLPAKVVEWLFYSMLNWHYNSSPVMESVIPLFLSHPNVTMEIVDEVNRYRRVFTG